MRTRTWLLAIPLVLLMALPTVLLMSTAGRAEDQRAQDQRAGAMPPPAVLLALLRGTMIALNQANVTGNYSVLRDLAAPSFRDANSSAALADRFRLWREDRLDFAAVALLDVQLSGAPAIGPDGTLRLKGYFPTAPLRIGFDIAFEPVDGHWRLGAIKAEPLEAEVTGALATAPPAKAPRPAKAASPATAAAVPASPAIFELPSASTLGIPLPPGDRPRS